MTTKVHIINAGPNDVSVYTCHRHRSGLGESVEREMDGKPNSNDQRVIPGHHVELYVYDLQDIRIVELP